MAFCSNCGAEIPEGSAFCPKCGASVKMQAGSTRGGSGEKTSRRQPVYYDQSEYEDSYRRSSRRSTAPDNEQGHGLAIGSLVCGIVGVVCWFFGYGSILSIILGIAGLVLAGNSKKDGNSEGMRTAGFILSLIALIGGCLVFLYLIFALAIVGAAWQGVFDLLR